MNKLYLIRKIDAMVDVIILEVLSSRRCDRVLEPIIRIVGRVDNGDKTVALEGRQISTFTRLRICRDVYIYTGTVINIFVLVT